MNSEPKPLSREFLLERGTCCSCGCLNCPWDFKEKKTGTKIIKGSKLNNVLSGK